MNIVYLIGNGFDLGLGLKTSYRDCVEAYLQRRKDTTDSCIKWLCKEMRDGGQETWSDAERAFGRLKFSAHLTDPEHQSKTAVDTYSHCIADFCNFFGRRIWDEADQFIVPEDQIKVVSEAFCERILRLDRFMESAPSMFYAAPFVNTDPTRTTDTPINLYFISFNYTRTLDRLTNVPIENDGYWHLKDIGSEKIIKIKVHKVCHAHGVVDESNIVFGVDHSDQITDVEVREYCERTGGMLKGKVAEMLGILSRDQAHALISQADRIVLFGLSYGETDRSWWKAVYNQLVGTTSSSLIVCPYETQQKSFISANVRTAIRAETIRKVFSTTFSDSADQTKRLQAMPYRKIGVLSTLKLHNNFTQAKPYDFFGLENLKKYVRPCS